MLTLRPARPVPCAGCATVAELRKRGDSFWDEFEFYLSDLMVGLVLDVVLVTLIAPVAVLGRPGGAGEWRVMGEGLGREAARVVGKRLPCV